MRSGTGPRSGVSLNETSLSADGAKVAPTAGEHRRSKGYVTSWRRPFRGVDLWERGAALSISHPRPPETPTTEPRHHHLATTATRCPTTDPRRHDLAPTVTRRTHPERRAVPSGRAVAEPAAVRRSRRQEPPGARATVPAGTRWCAGSYDRRVDTADRADVAIVGAGIIGLAHAVEAVRTGHSVIMIDRDSRAVG